MHESIPKDVQTILNQIVQENGFNDYTMHERPGSKPGDGFNSDLLCITVADNASDKQLDIVCKTCKDSNLYIFFDREVLFYNKLMPILAKFQEERISSKIDHFLSYPKCLAAVEKNDQKQHVVVMEDIRLQGFKMRNRAELTPIENMCLVMREIGKFHGLSIAMKDQQPDQFAIIKQSTDIHGIVCGRLMEEYFHQYFNCAIKALKNENHQNIMRDIRNNYSLFMRDCVNNSESSDHFLVLTHGDLWNNNILYRYSEDVSYHVSGRIVDACFLDWQFARYGSIALDLLYIIFSAIDRSLRDKEYENLLHTYYHSLSKSVSLLGTNQNKLFTFEELKNEMKRCGNFVLAMMPVLIYGSSAHQTIGQNSKAALNVNDKLEYERRMNEILEDVVGMGCFHKDDYKNDKESKNVSLNGLALS